MRTANGGWQREIRAGNNFLPSAQIAGGGIYQGKTENTNISTSLLLAQDAVHQKTLIQQEQKLDRVLIYGSLAAAIILVLII